MTELKNYKMFIGGEWSDSDNLKTFETLNPENNKPWARVPEASSVSYTHLTLPTNREV